MKLSIFLSDKELAERFGITRQSIWRWVSTTDFPAPVKLSPGCSRWRLADVENWEKSKASAA